MEPQDSAPAIQLTIDGDARHPIGAKIVGALTLNASAADSVPPRDVVVHLQQGVHGAQRSRDRSLTLHRRPLTLEAGVPQRFELLVPCHTPTYVGDDVRVRWYVAVYPATTRGEVITSKEVVVVPGVLGGAPPERPAPYRESPVTAPPRPVWPQLRQLQARGEPGDLGVRRYMATVSEAPSLQPVPVGWLFNSLFGVGALIAGAGGFTLIAAMLYAPFTLLGLGPTGDAIAGGTIVLVLGAALVSTWWQRGVQLARALLARWRFGKLELAFEEAPAIAGVDELLQATLLVRSHRAHPIQALTWDLHYVEAESSERRKLHRGGTSRSYIHWSRVLHRADGGSAPPFEATPEPTRIPVKMRVPPAGPASLYTDTRRLSWALRVTVESPIGQIRAWHDVLVVPFRSAPTV